MTFGWTSVRSTNSALKFSKAWQSFPTLLFTPDTLYCLCLPLFAPSVLFRPSSSYPSATPALITCTPQELSHQGEPTPAQDTQDFYLHYLASTQALLAYRCLVWAYQLIEYQMCKEWSLAEFDTLGKSTSAPLSIGWAVNKNYQPYLGEQEEEQLL